MVAILYKELRIQIFCDTIITYKYLLNCTIHFKTFKQAVSKEYFKTNNTYYIIIVISLANSNITSSLAPLLRNLVPANSLDRLAIKVRYTGLPKTEISDENRL